MLCRRIERDKLDILIDIFHISQLGAPCTVGCNKAVVHEITLMRTGIVETCAVFVHAVNLQIAVLDVLGIVY